MISHVHDDEHEAHNDEHEAPDEDYEKHGYAHQDMSHKDHDDANNICHDAIT